MSRKGKPSYDLLMRLEKEIPGIYLDSIFGTKPVGDAKAIAEGTSNAVPIQDMVREHYDNETSKILAPFSKLEIIEKRSILRELNKLLQSTGRGVYERESPDDVVRMMEEFVPKEIAFISADTAKKENK